MNKIINYYKNNLKNNIEDKIIFFLIFTTIGNIIIASFKFIISLVLPSLWFAANSFFLFVLCASRLVTMRKYKKYRIEEDKEKRYEMGLKNYKFNGIMLVVLALSYFAISLYMFNRGTNTNMHKYVTYIVAFNAFWSIGWAIYGMIKYKKDKTPIIRAVKITNFANALTSIVLTQVVLLDTFNGSEGLNKINGVTGMCVSLIIVLIGLYMIFSSNKAKC